MKCARPSCSKEAATEQKYCCAGCAPFASLSNRETPRKPGLSREEIEKFQKRARFIARSRGYHELADDFAQEVFVAFARGWHSTLEQLFVEFLRSNFGRSGSPKGNAQGLARASTISLDAPSGHEDGSLNHEIVAAREEEAPILTAGENAFLFNGVEADIYEMHFVQSLSNVEIAGILGVSESRISQLIGPMRKRIREHYEAKRLRERFEDDASFGVLEVQWLGI